ncbi:hypothetical protein NDI37_01120 [Funiculus sociatus GB2-A5]|uniref:Uncharacterized protein n=1 Tax=Funiculus sociatus GB2-A5 TaxID=2933946 RepID=A0ABV0JI40_9CYAN|nr:MULTISPECIES: hypothetical protein [unclassified Trichocoleus]
MGFQIIGRIPSAAHLSDGRVVDALMMYRPLVISSVKSRQVVRLSGWKKLTTFKR